MNKPNKPRQFDPRRYLTAPCEYKIGTEERILVQSFRASCLRPVTVEGDNLEADENFTGTKVRTISEGCRTGRIVHSGNELSE